MSGSRHFAVVEGRQVLYRRFGEGPAVFVLHGSPQASRAVIAVAEACAARGLCAIAPDTPGAGMSDPLPGERPTSADYARHLHGLADVLGLKRVGLYGFHTGAATACAFAGLFPDRTAAVALEGLPAWTEDERADFTANYLPSFQPSWDGSHMAWLWARMEEQVVFFPWSSPTPGARMRYPVTLKEGVHANCMDLLDAGDSYRAVYQAAFDFRLAEWLPRLAAPALIATTEFDVLREHLERPEMAGRGRAFAGLPEMQAAVADHLGGHPGDAAPPAPDLPDRGFVEVGGETLAWRASTGKGQPVLRLHAAGERSVVPVEADRPVITLDLPGHGDSAEGWAAPIYGLEAWTAPVATALDRLGRDDLTAEGAGIGGHIALALHQQGRARAAHATGPGYGPQPAAGFGSVSLAPEWDGAHLVRAWRIARWEGLYSPWHDRVPAQARTPFETLDPASIHRRAVGLLKAHDRWLAAATLEGQLSAVAPNVR